MPPVGQNRTFGNGPVSALTAASPPAGTAGKNLTSSNPCVTQAMRSDAVWMPGTNGRAPDEAACNSSLDWPGLMAKAAPISWTTSRSRGANTVPMPTTASFTSAMMARAYRRPLVPAEREKLLGFYRSLREKSSLSHEEAIRDSIVSVLMSPKFAYRIDAGGTQQGAQPLSSYGLASRHSAGPQ